MESLFGFDFTEVRIHADDNASDSAALLNARAYTIGQDIIFSRNSYSPSTTMGRKLIAHELTHVVQWLRHPDSSLNIYPQLVTATPVHGPESLAGFLLWGSVKQKAYSGLIDLLKSGLGKV